VNEGDVYGGWILTVVVKGIKFGRMELSAYTTVKIDFQEYESD
jgi:hypothetical protein